MSLNEQGFLSPDIQGWVAKHRRDYSEGFELANALNRAGVRLLFACQPNRDSAQQLAVSLLFNRALSHFQGALVLIERGAVVSAKVLLRVMLEAIFRLGACVKEPQFIDALLKDDRRQQADLIRALIELSPEQNAVPAAELEALRQQEIALRAEIKAVGQPKMSAFDTAKRAGLLDLYRVFYVPYSNVVHTAIRDLDVHIREGAQGEIESLKWGPQSAEVDDLLDAAMQILFRASHFAMHIFSSPEAQAEFTRLWELHSARLGRKPDPRIT